MDNVFVTVKSGGRILVPAAIRRRLKIREGMRIRVSEENGRIMLQPLRPEFIDQMTGCLAGVPSLLDALEEDRRQERKHERQRERDLRRLLEQ